MSASGETNFPGTISPVLWLVYSNLQSIRPTCCIVKTSPRRLVVSFLSYFSCLLQIALTRRAMAASLGGSATPVMVCGPHERVGLPTVDLIEPILASDLLLECRSSCLLRSRCFLKAAHTNACVYGLTASASSTMPFISGRQNS